jgi:hypothetical protein
MEKDPLPARDEVPESLAGFGECGLLPVVVS